eukprot:531128-Prorocentrum_minimum.AAC.1
MSRHVLDLSRFDGAFSLSNYHWCRFFKNEQQAELDFMLLSGTPLREPIQAQGSMVMNNSMEIEMAYRDYQLGKFGYPWDHALTEDEWLRHVEKHRPSMMMK